MIPDTLDGWTLEALGSLVQQGVFESDRFDFKEMLPHGKHDKDKLRLRKTCAAFANSTGGFLVVGVKDDKGLTVADRLVGLDSANDFPEQFGNYAAQVEPSVEWTFKNPPVGVGNGRVIHVVHIPSSARQPHGVFEEQRWWFCKRTSKGTETMSYQELQAAFTAKRSKLAKLRFMIAEIEHIKTVANSMAAGGRTRTWDGAIPKIDIAPASAQLPEVFDLIMADAALVKWLQNLRDAVNGVEEIRSTPWGNNQMDRQVLARHMGRCGGEILHAVDQVLPGLLKAEEHAST